MKFKAEIDIMPLKSLLDPQGKAVTASMKNIDLSEIENVRIGKHITLDVEVREFRICRKYGRYCLSEMLQSNNGIVHI